MDDASREFFARDENSYTLRYEDLILSPQETLQQLCERIGVEYEATMLDTSQTGKMVNSANVAWKSKVSQPIDHNRISVWRNELTEEQNRLAEALLGDRIKSYQYPLVCDLDQFGEIFPTSLLTSKYGELQNLVNISKVRFWKVYPDEKPKVRVYLGDPGSKEWKENRGKTKNFSKLIADFILSVLSRNKMFWLPDPDAFGWSGYGAYIIKHLLRPYLLKVN
jgi:hypothetical protein